MCGMLKKFTQSDLKDALSDVFAASGAYVDKIYFNTGFDANNKPIFNDMRVTFEESSTNTNVTAGKSYVYHPDEIAVMLNTHFNSQGYTSCNEDGIANIQFQMSTRMIGRDSEKRMPVPVFNGCIVEVEKLNENIMTDAQEQKEDMTQTDQEPQTAKAQLSLADIRRNEQVESLQECNDRELAELITTHFDSHPALPGEASLRNMYGFADSLNQGYVTEMPSDVRAAVIDRFAYTRIRETKMEHTGLVDPSAIMAQTMSQDGVVTMKAANVEIQKLSNGEETHAYVLAQNNDGKYQTVGRLPDKFLTNNPMNVESCRGELQITDYSNGKMKNVSMRVVVDTDIMSGDVIDLTDDMLAGIGQESGLVQ